MNDLRILFSAWPRCVSLRGFSKRVGARPAGRWAGAGQGPRGAPVGVRWPVVQRVGLLGAPARARQAAGAGAAWRPRRGGRGRWARTPGLLSSRPWYTRLASQKRCSSGSRCAELARMLKPVLGRLTVSLYGESPAARRAARCGAPGAPRPAPARTAPAHRRPCPSACPWACRRRAPPPRRHGHAGTAAPGTAAAAPASSAPGRSARAGTPAGALRAQRSARTPLSRCLHGALDEGAARPPQALRQPVAAAHGQQAGRVRPHCAAAAAHIFLAGMKSGCRQPARQRPMRWNFIDSLMALQTQLEVAEVPLSWPYGTLGLRFHRSAGPWLMCELSEWISERMDGCRHAHFSLIAARLRTRRAGPGGLPGRARQRCTAPPPAKARARPRTRRRAAQPQAPDRAS